MTKKDNPQAQKQAQDKAANTNDAVASDESVIDNAEVDAVAEPNKEAGNNSVADDKGTPSEDASESLQEQLSAALEQVQEQQESVLRAQAEVQNIRRRAEQDVAKAHKFGQEKLVLEILNLLDNLERAITAGQAESATLESVREGVELTHKTMLDSLSKIAVEALDPHGEPFNPDQHEAMTAVPNPDMEPNTVMEVFQKGYTLNDRLIRPARVVVSKAP